MSKPATASDSLDRRIGVLISGRGTNLQAIIDAIAEQRLDASVAVVISNRPDAAGLARAGQAGIETLVLDHEDKAAYPKRENYDRALIKELQTRKVRLVCLAGFMRLLSPVFIDAFPNRVVNVHPSLLPSFPGTNAQYQAWQHGVKCTGATVHIVTAELDGGPIILQEALAVREDDSPETLASRILEIEHRLYPKAIQMMLDGQWRLDGRRFLVGS